MQENIEEMKRNAVYFDGEPPEGWEFITMTRNADDSLRFRYYRDEKGGYRFTTQRMRRDYMQCAVREERGRTYAKRVYTGPRRTKRRRMV